MNFIISTITKYYQGNLHVSPARIGAVRNTYRILIIKLNTDSSCPKARKIPCYVIQVYFILTAVIYSKMMKMCCVASEKMEDFTVATVRMCGVASEKMEGFTVATVRMCGVASEKMEGFTVATM